MSDITIAPRRFCVDCRHIARGDFNSFCTLYAVTDPVTGVDRYRYAENVRAPGEDCGPEGKLWEARE